MVMVVTMARNDLYLSLPSPTGQAAHSERLLRSGVTTNSSPESLTPSSSASQLPSVTEQDTTATPTATPTPNSTSPSSQDGTIVASESGVSKPQDSSVDAGSSGSSQNDLATGVEGQATSDGGSVFKKMTKSFGTAKDALVKLAKNEW